MPSQGSTRSLQGQKAAAVRWGKPDVDTIDRDFAAAKLEQYIERIVSEAPPLTSAQRDRLALLLRGGGAL
jgi:hypothetical protein